MTVINGERRPLPVVDAIQVLLVAGGGGGGNSAGGGGGGLLMLDNYKVSDGVTYAITIGAGGAGTALATEVGANGSDTEFEALIEKPNSVYFDGTSDYISAPPSSAWVFAGDVTFECWIYISGNSAADSGGNRSAVLFRNAVTGTVNFQFVLGGDATKTGTSLAVFRSNDLNYAVNYDFAKTTWYHVAAVRASNVWTFYVNGTAIGTPLSFAGSIGSSLRTMEIGGSGYTGYPNVLNGYISNARMVNGTAVYTKDFIPPTQSLTAIANTSLLTCQSTTFRDNSTNNFAITATGNATVVPTSPFYLTTNSLTGYSTYFDGNGDWLTTPNTGSFNFSSASVDFTIEAWVYNTGPNQFRGITGSRANLTAHGWCVYISNINQLAMGSTIVGQSYADRVMNTTTIPGNTWTHIALVKDATGYVGYVNGVGGTKLALTNGLDYQAGQVLIIGALGSGGEYPFTGYISNFRIIKGTAVYTSNFTPPTQPLTAIANTSLLTCQREQFIDNSTNSFAITPNGNTTNLLTSPFNISQNTVFDYGLFFNGTSDAVTFSPGATIAFGTGDFTVEAWIYVTATPDASWGSYIVDGRNSGQLFAWAYILGANRSISWYTGATSIDTSAAVFNLNTWTHVAYSRSGTTYRHFVNGTIVSTGTDNGDYTVSPTTSYIGTRFSSQGFFPGYMSNLRIIKGTAAYTANFTPSRFINLTPNTSLLTCQSSALRDNSVNRFALTKSGESNGIFVSRTNNLTLTETFNHSSYFDGVSSFLYVAPNTLFDLASSSVPLTVEAWIYIVGTGGSIVSEVHTGGSNPITFCLSLGPSATTTSNALWFGYYNGSSWVTAAYSTTLVQNLWYHVAGVYTGSALNLYVNGVLAATTGASAMPTTTNNGIVIGRRWDVSATPYFSGYIRDLRIVKGTAVYTSDFVPSRSPLTAITNTILLTCQNSEFVDNSSNNVPIISRGFPIEVAVSPFTILDSKGGGGGGTYNGSSSLAGIQGGSGGGAPGTGTGQGRSAGTNVIGQGQPGGAGTAIDGSGQPGGGGGAILPGFAAAAGIAGAGGTGYQWPINQYGYSTYFASSTDYLTFDSLVTSQGVFAGSGAFTFEAWVYPITSSWMLITNLNTAASAAWWEIYHTAADGIGLVFGLYGSSSATAKTSRAIPNFAWTHIVVQRRSNNTIDIYYDGILQTVTNGFYGGYIGYDLTAGTIAKIGAGGYATAGPMLVSNIRFTKNQQVYTSDFIPSITPLTSLGTATKLLCCQSNNFANNAPTNFNLVSSGVPRAVSIGPFRTSNREYSYFFDGSGDYLSVPYNSAFNLSTSNFTIECWFSVAAGLGGTPQIMGMAAGTNSTRSFYLYITASNFPVFGYYVDGTTVINLTSSVSITGQTWYHIAVTRSSGTTRMFLNGVQVATSAAQNGAMYTIGSAVIELGREAAFNGNYLTGYISNARIINGTALYTGNFTVPTTSLTAISGTSLLTCKGTTISDTSVNNHTLTVNGNVRRTINDPFLTYDYYSGGGAGGGGGTSGGGLGGAGAANQTAITNSGGGGGSTKNGGSGVAVIKYPRSSRPATEITGSYEIIEDNDYRFYKWTGSGTIKF